MTHFVLKIKNSNDCLCDKENISKSLLCFQGYQLRSDLHVINFLLKACIETLKIDKSVINALRKRNTLRSTLVSAFSY